jgi:hypothetical protein
MRALIALALLMSAGGIIAAVWIGDIPRRQKVQDRLGQEMTKEIELDGRKFIVTKFRERTP